MIPRENVRLGDRIRAYIYEFRCEDPCPLFSDARPAKIHVDAVPAPQNRDGVVEIKSVARDPGSLAQNRGYFEGFFDSTWSVSRYWCARAGRRQRVAGREALTSSSGISFSMPRFMLRAGACRSHEGRARWVTPKLHPSCCPESLARDRQLGARTCGLRHN